MRALLFAFALAFGIAPVALAHEPRTGPRGGALVDAGSYHIEVITKEATLDVYVSDAGDNPLPAAGFKALAILAVDGKSVRVALAPAADGQKLTGTAEGPLGKRAKGAVQLTGPDGKTATGKIN